jgi:DNA-3-methyladenine glycosylase
MGNKKKILTNSFFDRDPVTVAKDLLGKVLCVKYKNLWLKAVITETEAYYRYDKASHSYKGYTERKKAIFMPAGTIYMYYSQGGDSLNISCKGEGNAVLIKAAIPFLQERGYEKKIAQMQKLNPQKNSRKPRELSKLCSGQALLCRALDLKISVWDQQKFDRKKFYIADHGIKLQNVVQTTRRGIAMGKDDHLPYRFVGDFLNII